MIEYSNNDFRLYHHGILGQKWGRKQGPPYPLDASDHSSAERKAGWRKSLESTGNVNRQPKTKSTNRNEESDENKKKGLTDKQKKALVIGAAALGTAVAVYGGVKVNKALKTIDAEALIAARKATSESLKLSTHEIINEAKTDLRDRVGINKVYYDAGTSSGRLGKEYSERIGATKNLKNVSKQTIDEIKYDVDDIATRIKGGDRSNSLKSLRDRTIAEDLKRTENEFNKAASNFEAAKRVSESARREAYAKRPDGNLSDYFDNYGAIDKSIRRHYKRPDGSLSSDYFDNRRAIDESIRRHYKRR